MAGNGNSGRRPQPSSLKLVAGSGGNRQVRAPAPAPVKVKLPSCPEWLSSAAKAEWRRVAKDLHALGLLTSLDRAVLVQYCEAWSDFLLIRTRINELTKAAGAERLMDTTPNGFRQMAAELIVCKQAEERLRTAASRIGLDPSARASIRRELPAPEQGRLFEDPVAQAAQKFGL